MKFILFTLLSVAYGFSVSLKNQVNRRNTMQPLRMSEVEDDPLAELRKKLKENPNFDYTKDPKMMEALESAIPQELRDMPMAIERLVVAFKDATSGVDSVANLDDAAKMFGSESLISSPQSTWFKEGAKMDETYSESTKKDLLQKLKSDYPQVPINE
jgi:hypothetical protein